MKSLFKEWRTWLLIGAVILSIWSLGPNPWAKGVVINNVEEGSPIKGKILPGSKIVSINEKSISSPEDLYQFENYTGMLRIVHDGEVSLVNMKGGKLGLEVKSAPKIKLDFGMDFIGGIRVLLKPEFEEGTNQSEKNEILEQVLSRLKTRMNVYGLREMSFQKMRDVSGNAYILIEMAGANKEDINELLNRKGEFEAYIPRTIDFENKTGKLSLMENEYKFELKNRSLIYNNKKYQINDTLKLSNLTFEVWNFTSNSSVLAGKVFSSKDIKYVYFSGQKAYVRKMNGGYEFNFQILISDNGADRFGKITSNIPILTDPKGEQYLKSKIYLFLDEKMVNSLRISGSLRGRAYTTPVITGGGRTEKEARQEMRRLQSILESGKLPVDVETVKIDRVSASLGNEFLKSVIIAGIGALISVLVIVYLRYRRKRIVLPMILTSLCEILIILGVASIIKWTIDLAAIAGIIAAIGTGVDDQIIIADESLGEKTKEKKMKYGIKKRVKRAFFIVLGAAATTIAAMSPLMVVGIGVMRGFAITTIVGVVVGISITRPAYGKILEKIG